MAKGNPGVPKPCAPRDMDKLRIVHERIKSAPGLTLMDTAKTMNTSRNCIVNRLTAMDKGGFLLSEDENGGLYSFRVLELRDAMELQRQIWT